MVRGWPRLEWAGEAPNIALRLDDLAMIDIDVEHTVAVDAMVLAVRAELPSGVVVERTRGNSSRVAILVRAEGIAHTRARTALYEGGCVELKAGPGELILAFGHHPSGAELEWRIASPGVLTSAIGIDDFPPSDELASADADTLSRIMDKMDGILAEMLGEPVVPRRQGTAGFVEIEDLDLDMVFTLPEGGSASLREIWTGPGTCQWVNLTPWRADSDSGSGLVKHSARDNGPVVTDFVTGTIHRMQLDDMVLDVADLELPELLAGVEVAPEPVGVDVQVAERTARMIGVRELGKLIYSDVPDSPRMAKDWALAEYAAKDRGEVFRTIRQVDRLVWDLGLPPMTISEVGGMSLFNTWCPPRHPTTGGEVDTFFRFMESFLPDAEQRENVLQWLAHKVQHPEDRMFALVLYGPQGSGKGTFWQLIQALFEPRHHSAVDIKEIYGAGFQDSLYRKLWVTVDEVSGEDATRWHGRMAAYEELKRFCEPQAGQRLLNIKYERQVDARVHASVGFATNHLAALPIHANDRRFYVVQTGGEIAPCSAIHRWLRVPENVGALYRHLEALEVKLSVLRAPASQTKTDMAEAGKSDIDVAVDEFVSMVRDAGGFWTTSQADRFCAAQVAEHGTDIIKPLKAALRRCAARTQVRRWGAKSFRVRELEGAQWSADALGTLERYLSEGKD